MATLRKILTFYVRFTPSYSAIGYYARGLPWKKLSPDFSGQTWLVTGGSEGVGGAAAKAAAEAGATVIAVARSPEKLRAFAASLGAGCRIVPELADCSLQSEILALVDRLQARGHSIDVVVNNVGVMKNSLSQTSEGFEASFALNLQGHYLLTRELLNRGLLSDRATMIEVSSGGMYNHPLLVKDMDKRTADYEGVRAYGLAKRGQVVLTHYWRSKYADSGKRFYVVHPGWVDTASVRRTMPRFRKILQSVLRSDEQGGDTIVWLASRRPAQRLSEAIWFDREERPVHIYAHTPRSADTAEDLVSFLDTNAARAQVGDRGLLGAADAAVRSVGK